MSAVSYKCPNCGGELTFDPQTQKYKCEYCFSYFTEEELEYLNRITWIKGSYIDFLRLWQPRFCYFIFSWHSLHSLS